MKNILLILAVLALAQCTAPIKQTGEGQGSTEQTGLATLAPSYFSPKVAPPLEGVNVPFQSFSLKGSGAQTFRTATGTDIVVPANAFVDGNGNVAKDVVLQYREFHDAASIVASGIPMHNPETGEYMQTAGMFEIQGTDAKGNPVRIQENKPLTIKMASFVPGDEYNFYSLTQENGQWKELGTQAPSPNQGKLEALGRLNRLCPTAPSMPSRLTNDDLVFEMDVDYSQFPELKPFNGVIWEYASKDLGNSPRSKPWVFDTDWSTIDIKATDEPGLYTLTLKSYNKTYSGTVKPVLKGENYEKALAGFQSKMQAYENNKKAYDEERSRVEKEANLQRSFSVNTFGMCNWDVWKNPNRVACASHPQFDSNAQLNGDFNKVSYFLICESNRSVIRYAQGDLNKFSFNPLMDNTLIAILPGNRVAIFGKEDFKNLDINEIRANKSAQFHMKTIDKTVTSVADLEGLLNG